MCVCVCFLFCDSQVPPGCWCVPVCTLNSHIPASMGLERCVSSVCLLTEKVYEDALKLDFCLCSIFPIYFPFTDSFCLWIWFRFIIFPWMWKHCMKCLKCVRLTVWGTSRWWRWNIAVPVTGGPGVFYLDASPQQALLDLLFIPLRSLISGQSPGSFCYLRSYITFITLNIFLMPVWLDSAMLSWLYSRWQVNPYLTVLLTCVWPYRPQSICVSTASSQCTATSSC